MAANDKLTNIMVDSSFVTAGIIIVFSVYALYSVRKGSKFELITLMLFGLLSTNLALIVYMWVYPTRNQMEADPDVLHSDLLRIVSISMTADLIKYLTWNATMWVFAFKYWQISIEMPRAINLRRQSFIMNQEGNPLVDSNRDSSVSLAPDEKATERKYTIGLWTGLIVNVVMIVVYITFYGMYCMKRDVGYGDFVCYTIVNFLGFVSGCFLGDALRRFYVTFKNLRGVHTNEKVMILHLSIFLIYFVITGLKTF